jgi:hypothetical protein
VRIDAADSLAQEPCFQQRHFLKLMHASPDSEQAVFGIIPEDGGHEVPNALLLQGLQPLIHFSALSVEGGTVRQRVRISANIQSRYTLHCRPPEKP